MDLLEFLFELVGWLFDGTDLLRFWRVWSALALGLMIAFAIFKTVPRRAVARVLSAPVVVGAMAVGLICEFRRR